MRSHCTHSTADIERQGMPLPRDPENEQSLRIDTERRPLRVERFERSAMPSAVSWIESPERSADMTISGTTLSSTEDRWPRSPCENPSTAAAGPQQRHDLPRLAQNHNIFMKMLFEDLNYMTELETCAGCRALSGGEEALREGTTA